jgi:ADP-heptose:LPS heptosyltransferase
VKILVISMAGIGDTLIATPLIHELRANFPEAMIDVLVRWAPAKDLLAGNPHLRRVHQCDFSEVGVPAFLKFLAGLRQERYDVSINTHPQSKVEYRVVARIIGATRRLSHSYDNSTFLDEWLITHQLAQDYAIHSADNNLKLLSLLGKAPKLAEHGFALFLTPEEMATAKNIADQYRLASRRVVGIHVGSGKTKNLRMKRWPVDNYIVLIQKLTTARPDVTVLLFGGPGEKEANARITAEAAHPNLVIPKTRSIREAAALMKHCEVFLSVDNVMLHLAAAMKVPKQVLIEAMTFGPSLEPYGRPYRLVKNPAVHGRNLDYYRYDGKGIRGSEEELRQIMEAVKVDDVFAAITEVLDQN